MLKLTPLGVGIAVVVLFFRGTVSFERVVSNTDPTEIAPQKQQLSIYPNPVNDNTIYIKVEDIAGIAEIELIDVNGRIILKRTEVLAYGESFPLSIKNFEKGVYVVLVKLDKHLLKEQLVIN